MSIYTKWGAQSFLAEFWRFRNFRHSFIHSFIHSV